MFCKDGYFEIKLPEGGTINVIKEIINGRNAIILDNDDEYYVIIEDGSSVFEIRGTADSKIIRDMANGIIKPVTPGDLTIISENFGSESSTYEIIYNTADGEEVTFIEAFGVVDEGSYFGAKVTGQMEEDVTIGEHSGKHFYTLESSENILVWTDGYSLFMISGEYDYQSMIDMAEHYTETEYKRG